MKVHSPRRLAICLAGLAFFAACTAARAESVVRVFKPLVKTGDAFTAPGGASLGVVTDLLGAGPGVGGTLVTLDRDTDGSGRPAVWLFDAAGRPRELVGFGAAASGLNSGAVFAEVGAIDANEPDGTILIGGTVQNPIKGGGTTIVRGVWALDPISLEQTPVFIGGPDGDRLTTYAGTNGRIIGEIRSNLIIAGGGAVLESFDFGEPVLQGSPFLYDGNPRRASLTDSGRGLAVIDVLPPDSSDRAALLRFGGGPADLLAVADQPAPGLADEPTFAFNLFSTPSVAIDANERVAFMAKLDVAGSTVSNDNDEVLYFAAAQGGAVPMLREGQTPAFIGPDLEFDTLGQTTFDDNGAIVFSAGIGDRARSSNSIWRIDDPTTFTLGDTPDLLVNLGQDPSDPDDIANLAPFDNSIAFTAEVLNDAGIARVTVQYVLEPSANRPTEILREGEVIDIDPTGLTDLRTVSGFRLLDVEETGIGAGDYLFQVTFTDFTKAVLTVSIPEPATAALVLLGLALRRRRHAA